MITLELIDKKSEKIQVMNTSRNRDFSSHRETPLYLKSAGNAPAGNVGVAIHDKPTQAHKQATPPQAHVGGARVTLET